MNGAGLRIREMAEFSRAAARLFDPSERIGLFAFLAVNPLAGVVIPGTGGVRKLRWGAMGRGKRGGARVIYFYKSQEGILYLMSAYSKSRKADLTETEKRALRRVVARL